MNKYYILAVFSGLISTFSQVLLKKSSNKKHDDVLHQYLNVYVIGGYAITFVCMVLTMIAYRGMPFRHGAVIESLGYVYILILGRIFFGERITKRKLLGIIAIVVGVIVFEIGG